MKKKKERKLKSSNLKINPCGILYNIYLHELNIFNNSRFLINQFSITEFNKFSIV